MSTRAARAALFMATAVIGGLVLDALILGLIMLAFLALPAGA